MTQTPTPAEETEFAEFQECCPYSSAEFPAAIARLLVHPALPVIARTFLGNIPYESFLEMAKTIKNVDEFQEKVISPTIHAILRKSSQGLTVSGIDHISRDRKYLFISNHRDILCDPALFTNGLFLNQRSTPCICLGDNLLVSSLVTDLVKMNKGVTVKRNLAIRDLFKFSSFLSRYIRRQIEGNLHSVWIAQREGRAKDGNDQTHPGVLKMLSLSGTGGFLERMEKLHIVPVAVSYEFDPCDLSKAREIYLRKQAGDGFQKAPDEDLLSMKAGIEEPKGRIHIGIGSEISESIQEAKQYESKKERLTKLVSGIDREIYRNYKNWPSNYIAYDYLKEPSESQRNFWINSKSSPHYSLAQKREFLDRMENKLQSLGWGESETNEVRENFLKSYANSVFNARGETPQT